jgi:phage replication-related protein YjqB (UPF0714/DUF867 family)
MLQPASLTELLGFDGVHEQVVLAPGSRVGFLALHGGHLEAVTGRIARTAAAWAGASAYVVHHPKGLDRHLPSVRYRRDESAALHEFLDHADVVVSIHGYGRVGWWTRLLMGGANRELARALATELAPRLPDYELIAEIDALPRELRGTHRANPVNATRGGGVQLELPPRVRGLSPLSPPPDLDGWSPPTRALIDGLVAFARRLDGEPDADHA